MRLLHTADWHLGKKLGLFPRIGEQVQAMDELIRIADEKEVDAVLIAGDVFDSANPPTEALELFYQTVKRLSKDGQRLVVVIAGNHDSPDKIDAPDPLARASGIIFLGYPNAVVKPMKLATGLEITRSDKGFAEFKLPGIDYPLRLLLTPYANEIRLKQFLGIEDKELLLNETLQQQWQTMADQYMDTKGVNILMAHLFLMERGGEMPEEPDGEKPIKIGNADLVYTDIIPAQVQYTALGHLHRHQHIGGHARPVVYSSSPLAYSFSEAGQSKYVCIIDLEPAAEPKVEPVKLTQGRSLYRKKFEDIDLAVQWLLENPYSLVELTIKSNTFLQSEDLKRLQQAHDGLIQIIPQVSLDAAMPQNGRNIDMAQDIKTLFADYFRSKHKQDPNEAIMALFQEILQEK